MKKLVKKGKKAIRRPFVLIITNGWKKDPDRVDPA